MNYYRKYFGVVLLAIGMLVSSPGAPGATIVQIGSSPEALPAQIALSEVEIRLAYETHGGCVGRCIRYEVTIRGDGHVQYQDLGGEPRDAVQVRIVPVDQVVGLVNEFLLARFFDAAENYDREPILVREGDVVRFRSRMGVDGPEWRLTVKIGPRVKAVRLYLGIPPELRRLRDVVEALGGPNSW